MKNLVFLFALVTILSFNKVFAQTIHVANNNPGAAAGTNVHTGTSALADAHTAAANGDIIYVVPSTTSYGTFTITKEITVFGIGIRPIKDLANKSMLTLINVNASNVRLSGLIVSDDIQLGLTLSSVNIANTVIENCRFGRIEMGSANSVTVSNLLVRNNVIEGFGSVATSLLLYGTSTTTITNNIIYTSCCTANSIRVTGATITYNTFISQGSRGIDANIVTNTFDHNIFYGVNVNLQAASINNTWTNNLSFGAVSMIFGAGASSNGTISGNVENSDPTFVSVPISDTWIDSHDFTLIVGSPAINVSGEDIGPSGGATPFDSEGNILPLIQSVTIPAVISQGSDLSVNIKAKGN